MKQELKKLIPKLQSNKRSLVRKLETAQFPKPSRWVFDLSMVDFKRSHELPQKFSQALSILDEGKPPSGVLVTEKTGSPFHLLNKGTP